MVQADLGKKRDPISKITTADRAGGMAQVVEHLPSKCNALNSTPNTTKIIIITIVTIILFKEDEIMLHLCNENNLVIKKRRSHNI
jgi:hypothetical protein